MLEQLTITNFQAHSSLQIDFDPEITTITGPSDVGKSAILRALRWLCLNQPQGDGFVREGTDLATVELVVDGRKVRRRRGKGDNTYILDQEEYKAFGSNVPDTIASFLNVGQSNFQGQHDSVFWFSESAGEVSRQLNAVVDLGVIDDSLANIAGRVKGYQSVAKVCRDRLRSAKDRKAELDWVLEADQQYQSIESLAGKLTQQTAAKVQLQDQYNAAKVAEEQQQTAIQQVTDVRVVGVAGQAAIQLQKQRELLQVLVVDLKTSKSVVEKGYPDIDSLGRLSDKWIETRLQRRHLQDVIEKIELQQFKVDKGYPDASKLSGLADEWLAIRDKGFELTGQIDNIRVSQSKVDAGHPDVSVLDLLRASYLEIAGKRKKLKTKILELNDLETQLVGCGCTLSEVESELSELTQGVCPVCGGELK